MASQVPQANGINFFDLLASKPDALVKIHGTIKVVWVASTFVYYTPAQSIFKWWWNARELRSEVEKMRDIRKNLAKLDHLAIDAEEVDNGEKIDGNLTFKISKAEKDFAKVINDKNTTMEQRILLGAHVIEGIKDLHHAGYVHGDMKPENCLVYQHASYLKISDFGKAKKLDSGKTASYWGNTRYAAPEGILSQKSDVYGAALILIRNFEEPFLVNGNALFEFDSKYQDMTASENLRGIEKYVVEHNSFLATNSGYETFLLTRIKRRFSMRNRSIEEQINQTIALDNYIDALEIKLKENSDMQSKAEPFCQLLKDMTTISSNRVLAVEALERYQKIMKQ